MSKQINIKCLECYKVDWDIKSNKSKRPSCHNSSVCSKKICYYRKIDHYRAKLRSYHRYLKFLGDKCFVCGSTDKLELHHIHSQVSGGLDTDINSVTLCNSCHKVITIYNRRLGIERKLLQ
jgi:hypothetical protein